MKKKILILFLSAMMVFPSTAYAKEKGDAAASSVSVSSSVATEETADDADKSETGEEKQEEKVEEGAADGAADGAAAEDAAVTSASSASEAAEGAEEDALSIADQIIQGASVGAVTPNTVTVEYVFDDESTDIWSEGSCNSIGNGYYITTKRRVLPDMDSDEFASLVQKKTEIYKSVNITLDEEAIEQHLQIFITDASGEKQLADRITTGSASNPEIGVLKTSVTTSKGAVLSSGLPEPGSPAVTYECQDGTYSKLQITVAGTDSNGNVRFSGGSDNVQLGTLIYNSDGYAFAMVVSSGRDSGSAIGTSTIAKELSVIDIPFAQQEVVEEEVKEEEEIGSQYDVSELKKKIEDAGEVDRTLYTEASLSSMDASVEEGRQLLETIDQINDQKKIDNAAANIQTAIDALQNKSTIMDYIPAIAIGIMIVAALILAYLLLFKGSKSKGSQTSKAAKKAKSSKSGKKALSRKTTKEILESSYDEEDDYDDEEENDDEDEDYDETDMDDGAGDTAVLKSQKKAYLIRISNGRKINIAKPKFLMGKEKAKVDYWIDHNSTVSRVHCRISQKNGEHYIEDLKSTNFTFVNEEKLAKDERRLLDDGDIIKVSNEEFEFHSGS